MDSGMKSSELLRLMLECERSEVEAAVAAFNLVKGHKRTATSKARRFTEQANEKIIRTLSDESSRQKHLPDLARDLYGSNTAAHRKNVMAQFYKLNKLRSKA